MKQTHPQAPELDPTVRHLYVHVPFCPSICPYCDFHVLTRRSGQVEAYLDHLEAEAQRLRSRYRIDLRTVYLGGGTPSFLRDAEMERLVGIVRENLGWGSQENTLEVNPGTVSAARAAHWRSLGLDRASVGVQSLDDATLRFLGRQHDARTAREAVSLLLEADFRVSGDLITAVEGQPLEDDIRGLAGLGVEHISAYTLTIEPGTEFARRGLEVSEEDERRGFEVTAARLGELGFARYEISNYARPGGESRHNLAYWTNQFYLGLGPGAAGHYPSSQPGVLAERVTRPHLHRWLAGESGEPERIGPEDYVTDALFMGLRLVRGVDLADLSRRSGLDVQARYAAVLERQLRRGTLILEGGTLRATDAGRWILNQVVTDFLEG
ncbi:oxygen-independent coproporphyrinogen-3 oxidase [Deinobacterium chartae]|uniref:Heme chaperone HemW n=1 Tax=Deinobacterium chartae TaxID=521158 RepID=A0A841I3H2_9DEIO|nr:radical SAM family heme chaperone HemW [Deinobacterium chartae]MBB6098879.1 oxygen-independent coproporphyrinogen-3 oxidase [Deinobacterium chartae]